MHQTSDKAWHAVPLEESFKTLKTSREGLRESEAARRLYKIGPNKLPERFRPGLLLIGLRQINNPLVIVLIAAMAISFTLGHILDGAFICFVVLLNMAIGAVQEWQAEESAAALNRTMHNTANILRNGTRRCIDVEELVPGDLVLLESGVIVPADLRLASDSTLKVDESLLTGESMPVDKASSALCAEDTPVGDRANMAYAGTLVVSGRGTGIVSETGLHTQIGTISGMLAGQGGKPPLLIRMETFSARIALVTVILALAIGAGQYLRGMGATDVFLLTIALAVSAIPEGLPMAITVALSIASSRMGRRNVIVRHLPAVEALGSCTLIATDKTGTLTANRLTAKRIVLADGRTYDVEGEGLELDGKVIETGSDEPAQATSPDLAPFIQTGLMANEADLEPVGNMAEVRGDAVDSAILILGHKLGIIEKELRRTHRQQACLSYEPERGYAASLDDGAEGTYLSVKGAPEKIIPMCRTGKAQARTLAESMAAEGFRVIALARRSIDKGLDTLIEDHLADLEFLGLVGLVDPLRSEASAAVKEARAAGVDVRIITGDHPDTALSIAHQIDPAWPVQNIITGKQLAGMSGEARDRAIADASLYARVEPAQKNTIVTALQKQGHFVAVTGDGVNDAPALKAAHVGVAMGEGGTDVARAASDLILADDNFASIVAGIEEGRAAYDNIRKIIWLLVSTAISEILLFALALAFDTPLPLSPLQILWLNLVTESIQNAALAFEGKEPDIMQRRPRAPREPIFNRQMIEQCVLIGVYVGAAAFALFYWLHVYQDYSAVAASNLVLLFMVCFNNFQTLNCRSETRSFFAIPLKANPFLAIGVVGAQLVHIGALYVPVLSDILDLSPVSLSEWSLVLALAASVLVIGEFYKLTISRPRAHRHMTPQPAG